MLTHLVILLDDTSVSYCHYENRCSERKLIDIDVLRKGIVWAMKENLNIQFVYPDYPLPEAYRQVIESIDHTKIGTMTCGENLDIVVLSSLQENVMPDKCYLWRSDLQTLNSNRDALKRLLTKVMRLNVVLTDLDLWKQSEFDCYKTILEDLADTVVELYKKGATLQFNLLTDRILLGKMNNCSAGDTNITLAPDGRFYACPAFYPDESIGSLSEGLNIPNKQLYKLDHAPICRWCDAYQCKRCVWLNKRLTLDINTPSHEQCVVAHIERNASQLLQQRLYENGIIMENSHEIKEIDYLDPFNQLKKWKLEKLWGK